MINFQNSFHYNKSVVIVVFQSHFVQVVFFSSRLSYNQRWRQEFSDGGADSSDEEAKIWFSGHYKCQKSPKKSFFTFQWGVACSDRGV